MQPQHGNIASADSRTTAASTDADLRPRPDQMDLAVSVASRGGASGQLPAGVGTDNAENKVEQYVVYLTGYNAAGKTSLGRYIADNHSEWHCVDGDEMVENDPELHQMVRNASLGVIGLMRGTFGSENLVEEVKPHEPEIRAEWEPFYRALFERLKQINKSKIVFVYHIWRQWTVDLFFEYFATSKIVELQVSRSELLERFVNRHVKDGMDLEERWRDIYSREAAIRARCGPEYKGNEDNYKEYCWWRYFFYREPIWEGWETRSTPNCHVVHHDHYEGAQQVERILNLRA